MRYYDSTHKRLIYIDQQATPEFWDEHWKVDASARERLMNPRDTVVSQVTRKFLKPSEGPILEAGCGNGQHVAALVHRGYQCTGIDSAANTVHALNQIAPELDVRLGDVRKMEFPTASFAGCWSLGVIEHFWEGCEPVVRELARVIRPGGYLFITIPYLSPLRRLKARLGLYPAWEGGARPEDFYQFALDHQQVTALMERLGFELVAVRPQDGIKGLKSEVPLVHAPLQALYDYRGRLFLLRAFRVGLSRLLAFFAGHTLLMVSRLLPQTPGREEE